MRYSTGLCLRSYILCMLILFLPSLAAPRTPAYEAIGNVLPTRDNTELQRFDGSHNQTNSWGYKCYTAEDRPGYSRPISKPDCIVNLFGLLSIAGANNPVRWDLYPAQSEWYIWRRAYRSCFVTMRRMAPGASDEFSLLDIAHQAAIVVDHCVVADCQFMGGGTLVGVRAAFRIEVANVAIPGHGDSALKNGSAMVA